METWDAVVVGAGQAGSRAAIALRQQGFAGSVLLIGRENDLPHARPPLSKDYLARETSFERLLISPESAWAERQVTLALGEEVLEVDVLAHQLQLARGTRLEFAKLIWAAGGEPRKLNCAGAELKGVFALRTRADADALIAEVDNGARRVVVVGGGYIGLEAAATLRKLGLEVTLLESLPRVLARVAGSELSAFYESEHRDHGVDLRTSVKIKSLQGEAGHVAGVELEDGTVLPADLVIVGIGIIPCVQPLRAAGAGGDNGVDVDALCRTCLTDIYAIGDCAAHVNRFARGMRVRVESIQNANDMATATAKTLCGQPTPYAATPWFWSNQYDLKLQTIGLSQGHDQATLRGDPAKRSFSVIYLLDGKVIALDCVNAARDFTQGRLLVETGAQVRPAALADASVALKDLA